MHLAVGDQEARKIASIICRGNFKEALIRRLLKGKYEDATEEAKTFWLFLHQKIYPGMVRVYKEYYKDGMQKGLPGLFHAISASDEALVLTILDHKYEEVFDEVLTNAVVPRPHHGSGRSETPNGTNQLSSSAPDPVPPGKEQLGSQPGRTTGPASPVQKRRGRKRKHKDGGNGTELSRLREEYVSYLKEIKTARFPVTSPPDHNGWYQAVLTSHYSRCSEIEGVVRELMITEATPPEWPIHYIYPEIQSDIVPMG